MATFQATDPDTGKVLTLEGDKPPSDEQLLKIFGEYQRRIGYTPKTNAVASEAIVAPAPARQNYFAPPEESISDYLSRSPAVQDVAMGIDRVWPSIKRQAGRAIRRLPGAQTAEVLYRTLPPMIRESSGAMDRVRESSDATNAMLYEKLGLPVEAAVKAGFNRARNYFMPPALPTITRGAVEYLRANPQFRDEFDAKYGDGASARVLGQ